LAADNSAVMAQRPRVLVVITLAEVGGAQSYVASLLPALAERFDVALAAHGPGPLATAARDAGVRFIPLRHLRRPLSPWRDLLALGELVRLFRRERPDIVHLNSSKALAVGRVAAVIARVPVRIVTVHGWAFSARSPLYRIAERILTPLTTATICVSQNELAVGLAARTCRADSSVVILNAVDVAGAPTAHLNGRLPQVVSVGRFRAPKDFPTLVEALGRLDRETFQAVFVGDGPDRELIPADAPADLVGERDDVPELLAASDLFVLSSRSEGLPISVLEAMAAGLPVVASAVGGIPELVVDGETGRLVPPGDPEALGDVLRELLADPDLRQQMGAAGRARAEELFDLPRFRQAHVELYERLLGR
jgi:glycosyltransferase involved in cell wall biosynthesis